MDHILETFDPLLQFLDMPLRQQLDLGALTSFVSSQTEQITDFGDGEAKIARSYPASL
jgi:hypothetical protein